MKGLKVAVASLLVTLAVWALMAWPLPRYALRAIPSSAANVEKGGIRRMIPGDHLQLLYHLWLAADTFKGNTPLFHNLYEFNTGNDAERKGRSTYYLPFSAFFWLGEALAGQAAGYNLAGLVALWLTFLFTWKLVGRFCADPWLSAVCALIGIIFPYRWITLLGGSPTGLAMMWVPIILYGLDLMVADRNRWGGLLAGIGLYVAEWGDTHVFFFSAVLTPFWCVFSFLARAGCRWPDKSETCSVLKATPFLAIFLALVLFQALQVHGEVSGSALAGKGRSIREVALNSPALAGLFKIRGAGASGRIYVGGYCALLLLAGSVVGLRRRGDKNRRLPWIVPASLAATLVGVALLATGVNNPGGERAWRLLTKLVPPYGMIRQPDKVFCLMPTLLAVSMGLILPAALLRATITWRRVLTSALVVPLLFDYGRQIRPTLCVLDQEQGAYLAVARDAAARGCRPHLLALPLWPGDSHYTSVNEYYVSLYRLRMVNGYGGTVKTKYRDEIFRPLESLNLGGIYDAQLDELLARGIGYIILHENLFPEKVSPFPVGLTLQALLNHPRLEHFAQDTTAWAFRILPADRQPLRSPLNFIAYSFPSRQREAERGFVTNAVIRRGEAGALGNAYVALRTPQAAVRLPETLARLDLPIHWLARLRGDGVLRAACIVDGATNTPEQCVVKNAEWAWVPIAISRETATRAVGATFILETGAVDLDAAILAAGEWKSPQVGESMELPAVCFFHAGYTAADLKSVVLRKECDPDLVVFYGPKLPVDAGRYEAQLACASEAPRGLLLGRFGIQGRENDSNVWVCVEAGVPAVICFKHPGNYPVSFGFEFARNADVYLRSVRLTRVE